MHTCWSVLRETVHIFSVAWFRDRLLFFLCNIVLFRVNQNDINSNVLLSATFSVILPLFSELRLKNVRCNIYTRARFNARSTISIWEDIKKCAHRSVSTLQTIFFLKPLCVATFFFKRWMSRYKAIKQVGIHDHIWTVLSWSAFTITSGHVYHQCLRSKHDMYTVGVHDQSTTCVRWAFTIKAGHVYRQCSRSKLGMSAVLISVHDQSWACLPSVFTIKHVCCPGQCSRSKQGMSTVSVHDQTHVCCPDQCSRSKLGMSTVSVHDQSWTCLPSVFTIKARHVYGGCSRSKHDMCTVGVHDQSTTCVRWVFTIKAYICVPSVFTIKARHVWGGCSRSKHMCAVSVHDQSTCVPSVFTIKAHVYRQCSRSKLDMVPAPVHEGKSTQISSYSVSNVSTTTLSVKVHYQTFLQACAVNVHSKAGHVHSLAILMVTNTDDGNRNHKPSRQCWWR